MKLSMRIKKNRAARMRLKDKKMGLRAKGMGANKSAVEKTMRGRIGRKLMTLPVRGPRRPGMRGMGMGMGMGMAMNTNKIASPGSQKMRLRRVAKAGRKLERKAKRASRMAKRAANMARRRAGGAMRRARMPMRRARVRRGRRM
jgi:hypothetical protein